MVMNSTCKRRVLRVQHGRDEISACVLLQERQQIIERGAYIAMPCGLMGFDGDDSAASFHAGGALLTLPPAPAPRNHQLAFVGDNYLTRLRVIYLAFTKRCVPFRPIGEMDRDASLQRAGIEYCDGERVKNADQIAQVDQQINT